MSDKNNFSPRILKEIRIGIASKLFYFWCDADGKYGPKNCCYVKWKVQDGPYKDEIHIIQIDFLNLGNGRSFPKNAPGLRFMTPMKHPHVFPTHICIDVLGIHTSEKQDWSPLYGLETIFNSIVVLLNDIEHLEKNEVRKFYDGNIKTDTYQIARDLISLKFTNE